MIYAQLTTEGGLIIATEADQQLAFPVSGDEPAEDPDDVMTELWENLDRLHILLNRIFNA